LIKDINLIQTLGGKAKSLEEFQDVFNSTSALNMLNTKYVIYNPEAPPLLNQNALGNVWFVEKPVIVNTPNEELSGVNKINPAKEAIIDKSYKDQITGTEYPVAAGDTITLKSYEPNELVYISKSKGERLAVFSEIYYPAGWNSYIDGKECKYFRADWVLRAMIVPAGDHEIRFAFEPSSYIMGNKISLVSSVVFILLLAGYLLAKFKFNSKAD
jgi:hypothetical protein